MIMFPPVLINYFDSTDVNDPPTNITLPTPYFKENSVEQVLLSPIILADQDGDLPLCTLVDSAGGRVKVVGTNLVVGPTMTDYESLLPPQQVNITLHCSDGNGMFIQKSFIISVKGEEYILSYTVMHAKKL